MAPESAGDLFDATEIDEILTLRTLALTDAERREARATDPRAADLLDRLDGLPPEMLERMHGAIRYLSPGPGKADKIRLKIWDNNNNNAIVYDSQLGAPDLADPTTAVAGGSIVVHK